MRWRDPRLLLGALTLCAVVIAVLLESEQTSPGPLAPVHAREAELGAVDGCSRCHGEWNGSMAEACEGCHPEIGAQLRAGRGFHGSRNTAECGRCHVEHHGDAVELAGERAFALAGVADRAAYQHDADGYALMGAHLELACDRCHPRADAPLLAKGEKRFLGLEQRCTSCHADPHEGRFAGDCGRCHGQEHPFRELANFVHVATFPLLGGHAGLACTACHAKGSAYSVDDLGGAGPKPPARACTDCHASPHGDRFIADVAARIGTSPGESCARCHWTLAASFVVQPPAMEPELHAVTGFALAGPHAIACARCHAEHAGEATFAERYPGRSAADCAACHADPHGAQFAVEGAARPSCTQCHALDRFVPSTLDLAAHAKAFPLDGAHSRIACVGCHTQAPGEPRVFRGTPRRCEECHPDPHGVRFDAWVAVLPALQTSAGTCSACHGSERFDDVGARFGVAEHEWAAGFALVGAHAQVPCTACHARSAEPDALGRRFGRVTALFPGPVDECATCHADVHRGAFDVAERTSCARCHTEESFRELRAPFDHGARTGFALTGAHATADCAACHGAADPATSGRTLGRVSDRFPGPPELCATCHRDPHAGAFDRPGMPRFIGDAQGCARCHATESFRALARESFDHAAFTAFPLQGRHAATACEACHVPPRDGGASGRRLGRAVGAACADCHEDPHAGQFVRDGSTACERCHAASSFTALHFDHDRDSLFALDARHARLACAACHKPWPLADGRPITRYKPLGTTCVDCHGFSKRGGR